MRALNSATSKSKYSTATQITCKCVLRNKAAENLRKQQHQWGNQALVNLSN